MATEIAVVPIGGMVVSSGGYEDRIRGQGGARGWGHSAGDGSNREPENEDIVQRNNNHCAIIALLYTSTTITTAN